MHRRMGRSMNKAVVSVAVCVLLLLPPLAACSGSFFPYGTYKTDSGSIDQMVLSPDGSFTFSGYGRVISTGTFSISGNELTWDVDSFCDERGGGGVVYIWTVEDEILHLQAKGEDICHGRRVSLDGAAYYLQP
jgi:hypothetical protein